jgi:hypothetical protein
MQHHNDISMQVVLCMQPAPACCSMLAAAHNKGRRLGEHGHRPRAIQIHVVMSNQSVTVTKRASDRQRGLGCGCSAVHNHGSSPDSLGSN